METAMSSARPICCRTITASLACREPYPTVDFGRLAASSWQTCHRAPHRTTRIQGSPMKYAFLLWQDETTMPAPGSAAFDAQNHAYGAFYEQVAAAGLFPSSEPVQPSAAGTS